MLHEMQNDTVLECCVCMTACTVLVCLHSADITGQQISVTLTSLGDQCDLQVTVPVV